MKMKEFVLTCVLIGHGYTRASHTDKSDLANKFSYSEKY
jgi:hypothetical protein